MTSINKPNLLLVGYNLFADGFKACANFLDKDYNVYFFPLLKYQKLELNIAQDLSKYIQGQPLDHYIDQLQPVQVAMDIVLLWYLDYFAYSWTNLDQFMEICHTCPKHIQFIGYSWDPLILKSEINPVRLQLIKNLKAYITGDGLELKYLENLKFINVYYGHSGFDPKITNYQPLPNSKYECDVSIVCTNLYGSTYHFPLEYVRLNRKQLVDHLYQHRQDFKFHIYGPESLKEHYPDCYQGLISYQDCPKVFSNSKINLCIHATSYQNYKDDLYFSERLPQIMGSRGLVYCETDYVRSWIVPGRHYVLADPVDPVNQIKFILDNYNQYEDIIRRGHQMALRYLTWDTLRNVLSQILKQ